MKNYNDYLNYSRRIYDVYMSISVLNWDMETFMPKNGNRFRSQQLSTLSDIAHNLETDDKFGCLLENLLIEKSLNSDQKRNIYLSHKKFLRKKKYSSSQQLSDKPTSLPPSKIIIICIVN